MALELTNEQKRVALEPLITIKEIWTGKVKGHHCVSGREECRHIPREETAFPTIHLESIFITSIIDVQKRRDIAIIDFSGAFLSTDNLYLIHIVLSVKTVERPLSSPIHAENIFPMINGLMQFHPWSSPRQYMECLRGSCYF